MFIDIYNYVVLCVVCNCNKNLIKYVWCSMIKFYVGELMEWVYLDFLGLIILRGNLFILMMVD